MNPNAERAFRIHYARVLIAQARYHRERNEKPDRFALWLLNVAAKARREAARMGGIQRGLFA